MGPLRLGLAILLWIVKMLQLMLDEGDVIEGRAWERTHNLDASSRSHQGKRRRHQHHIYCEDEVALSRQGRRRSHYSKVSNDSLSINGHNFTFDFVADTYATRAGFR
ncbi:hypothetical protein ACSQ67_023551 [Phaseolus vulgaris]